MKIAMIGSGYVGLVSGICFSDFGHEVVCVDTNQAKIDALKDGVVPIYEPGLDALLVKNVKAGRLSFTTDLAAAVKGAEAVFIGVGTPSRRGDGNADLTYIFAAARDLAGCIEPGTVVVTKSTVPVGTNRKIEAEIRAISPGLEFSVASNPEFLREGSAIEDFMRPDRVVVGVENTHSEKVLREVYAPLYLRDFPIMFTDLESAEMIKYAANAFLATKITFINEIAALCERVGADVKDVSKGMGLDNRIGRQFLRAGPGYGGSCFPKDTRALAYMGVEHDQPLRIVESVIEINEDIKIAMVDKVASLIGDDLKGKRIAVLGVTFKPETDDMRDAPSLTIVPGLKERGCDLVLCDPQGKKEGHEHFPYAEWAEDAYAAASGADAVVILTEWNEFRALDLDRMAASMKRPLMADLRNVYSRETVLNAGFERFVGVGRGCAD
jgi:UDPglucose 6-dehydrogenase